MRTSPYDNTPVIVALSEIQSKKMGKIFESLRKTAISAYNKPLLMPLPMEINFEGPACPTFIQGRGLRQAYVILTLKGGAEPIHFKGETTILEITYYRIRELAFSFEYLKRFETFRRPAAGTIEDIRVVSKYAEYIKEIFNVMYKNVYDKILPLNANLAIKKNGDFALDNSDSLLLFDLLNESTFAEVNTFLESIEKISDDEMGCCIIMSSYNFFHPIHQLMSPAALALSFWQYNLLGLKKTGRDENQFSKQSLPKVTYIDLTGFFSEINFEMVNALSENIQTILIYDSSTGGPNILKGGNYDPGQDLRARDRNYNQISDDKGLFVPLKSTNSYGQKNYTPNDMLGIFDEIIVRAVEKFKPFIIVLNVSLIFDESSNMPFWLDEKAFGEIVNTLSNLCDGKVIVYPFKLPDLSKNLTDRDTFMRLKNLVRDKPKQAQRLENLFAKYGVPYNEIYLKNCLSSILEALAGMRNSNMWERSDIRKRFGTNPIKADTVHQISRYYKDQNFYNFLYSKACGALARLNLENVTKAKKGKTNKIPVFFNKEGKTAMLRLSSQSGNRKIELNEDSQYIIDYSIDEEPSLYILNALISDIQYGVASSSISHVKLSLELDDTTQPHVTISGNDFNEMVQFEIKKETNFYRDMSICKINDVVFQVYGTQVKENGDKKDITQIWCYDFEKTQSFQIKIKGAQPNIMPRHSVTTCAFEKDGINYIYIFGGLAQPKTQYNGRVWGSLDIIDIVEIYKTASPITCNSEWEYSSIPKDKMYKASNASYIPFIQSYASYLKDQKKIVILGGRMFRDSVQDWSFPIFEFDIDEQRFSSFQVVLNYARNGFARKEVVNHNSKKAAFPIAVANKNVNFRMNEQDQKFNFIIPTQDDEYIYTYSFDWNTKDCQYEQILHKDEKTDEKTPVLPVQSTNPKNISMPTKLSEVINYMSRATPDFSKAIVKLVDWRGAISDETITEETLIDKIKEMGLSIQDIEALIKPKDQSTSVSSQDTKTTESTSTSTSSSTISTTSSSLVKDFKDIFINRDNRLQQLKNFITKNSAVLLTGEEPSFLNVDQSFRKSCLDPEYEDLEWEIKKNGWNMIRLCVNLIDWRQNNILEKITGEDLDEQTKLLQEGGAGIIFDSEDKTQTTLDNMDSLFKNEKFRKMLISDTKQLKNLRKALSGSEEQSFLFNDSTRDSETFDSFCEVSRLKMFTKDDLMWNDLETEQRVKVVEILKKAIVQFSKLSEDPNSFSSKDFKELNQELQNVRKEIAPKGKDLNLSVSLFSLEDTVRSTSVSTAASTSYVYSQSGYSQQFDAKDWLDASRSTASTNSSTRNMSNLSLSADQIKPDGFIFVKPPPVKEEISNFSTKQLLHTLTIASQQVINVSHMFRAGVIPQIEYKRDLFEKKFLDQLRRLRKLMEQSTNPEGSTMDISKGSSLDATTAIGPVKQLGVDDSIDGKNTGNLLDELDRTQAQIQPEQASKRIPEQPKPVSEQPKPIAEQPKPVEQKLEKPVVQAEKPVAKPVEVKPQEIRTEKLSLPSVSIQEEEEKKIDDVQAFKAALSAKNNFRAFFNSSRSELTILATGKNGEIVSRRLRFKVMIKDDQNSNYILEDISFENSPSSIWIHNDCIMCYVDQTIRIRYPDVHKAFKSWILYADLKASLDQLASRNPVENLVFRKLFLITQDDQVINRSLVSDEKDLFLLAGKSYRFKKNNAQTNNQVSKYFLDKFTKVDQLSADLKDNEADNLESIQGDSVSVSTPELIFVCQRKKPTQIEIYNKANGCGEKAIPLPQDKLKKEKWDNWFASMTLVNFRGKNEILFTLSCTDANRKFMLYDIEDESFEEKEVQLKAIDDKGFQPLNSGFEELEVNKNAEPIKENIMFYVSRDDEAKFVTCEISIT